LNWAFIVNHGRLFLFEEIPEHCSTCKVVVKSAKLDLCKNPQSKQGYIQAMPMRLQAAERQDQFPCPQTVLFVKCPSLTPPNLDFAENPQSG
jgi:hypothetical protein